MTQMTLFLFSFNHLPLVTIKEVLVEMVDMADIAEEVHVVDEEEEEAGTEKVSIHSPLNPLSFLPSKILLHFLVRQLKVLQIKILSKVNYKDN